MEIKCENKCGNLTKEGSIYCETCEISLNDLLIDENEKYKQKINKIKDIIALFESSLEYNMMGAINIQCINKKLKEIIE